ncbi:hypothetical protein KKA85_10580 [bacterium]|nr:hypothetical protein [bacterium]MBU1676213.1 hypothetical protein [bacterium]
MPVYERGYRHWEHSGRRAAPAWWVIARRGIAEPVKSRRLLFLLVVAWVPAIVKGGILYFTFKMGELTRLLGGAWTDITAAGFHAFLKWQSPFVLIVLAIIGANLITKDRRENGLALYFSRPLGLRDYVAGKGAIIMTYYFAVTLFPICALCIFGYLVTNGATGMEMLLEIPLRASAYCLLAGAAYALVLLAISALMTRTAFSVTWWVLLVAGTDALAEINVLFDARLAIMSFPGQFLNAGTIFFGAPRHLESVAPAVSLALVVLYAAAGWSILRSRIRPVEVVS